MDNLKRLQTRIDDLEKRVAELENILVAEDPLYEDAKRLVKKHNKASIIFLQKHLLIDFDRAEKILNRLKEENVVSELY